MANIRENKKGSKTISYRFIAYLGKDAQGKQIRRYTTWTPTDGLTPSKAFKAAERAADVWEQDVKAEFQKEQSWPCGQHAKNYNKHSFYPTISKHFAFTSAIKG